ncbi:MAG: hypothetical protein RLZZ630_180 [Bacteroidota bacterium]
MNFHSFRSLGLGMVFGLLSYISPVQAAEVREPAIIPRPNNLTLSKGYFQVIPSSTILADGQALPAARLLQAWTKSSFGYAWPIVSATRGKSQLIVYSLVSDSSERYTLRMTKKRIVVEGGAKGLVRATATILQLVQAAEEDPHHRIPCLTIHDEPVFKYRGVHLDVCRHFMSKDFVKRYIDLLAMHKMNTFHWHLTEDQGWRIEIKKYPLLTQVGAWRNGSMVGPYRDQLFDTIRYGGFYTQDDIREVVAYASERQITIIPEIEMPGHAVAALAAYPQYSCTGQVKEVARGWGVFDDVFCVNDSTFAFLEDVLSEVMQLFPSRYIHIGGDECPKSRWKVCPKCIETRYANNLKDEHELQSYFIRRIEKFLNSKGRQIIGWDEILEGGLAPNATVMSWRGTEGGIAAAREKHDVVMTPGSHCYFDHYQGERGSEPLAIGGYTPLEKVYAYRPIPSELNPEEHRYILGAQANVWTEYMPDSSQVEYMLLPRLCALSEVLWTDTIRHDEQEFYDRVLRHQRLLDRWKVNYSTTWMAPTLQVEPGPVVPSLRLGLESKFPQTIEWAWSTPETKVRLMPYEGPFVATSSGTLIVRSTAGNVVKQLSFPFEFSNSTGARVELSVPGDRNYNNPAFTLCDGQTGSYPWSGKQWVGWIGKNAEVNIDLGGEKEVDSVVVTVLHDPVSWIHAPGSIVINVGTTTVASGVTGRETGLMRIVLPVKIKTRNLQVGFLSLGKNPEGSAGAGEDGWMFVSEIQVY